jgi:transposase
MTGRQIISQNTLVKTTFDWINRSTFYRQILRFSEQKLGNLIPQCCRVSLRGNRRLIVDQAPFHGSQKVREWVRAHRTRLRIFFLPNRSPELNPDEQVWNEIKNNKIGKQPIKNKRDLKKRLYSALRSLQRQSERIRSFFQLPDTLYASMNVR